jgi:hypothetical protein
MVAIVAMTRPSQALMVYDPRLLDPPAVFLIMQMQQDVVTYEQCLQHPLHPHQIHDIVAELKFMFATMHYISDQSLIKRVTSLLHRAGSQIFRGCHELLLRCAVLVDECRQNQDSQLRNKNTNTTGTEPAITASVMPSFDSMELAICACDDVLVHLDPTMKQFYIYDLRPSLVVFMWDTESDISSSDSDSHVHADRAAQT